jgi:ComF family protein
MRFHNAEDKSSVPDGLSSLTALARYDGDVPRLVAALKYRGERHVVDHLARLLSSRWPADQLIDVVCWAPTSVRRRRERGFDQAEILARAVASNIDRPVMSLLVRISDAQSQTGKTASQRHAGVAFTVHEQRAQCISGYHVLVIDDVVTTGATMTAAAQALLVAGSSGVHGMSIAVTPRKCTALKQ